MHLRDNIGMIRQTTGRILWRRSPIPLLLQALLFLSRQGLLAEEGSIKPLRPQQMAKASVRIAAVQVTGPWLWGVAPQPGKDPADTAIAYIERAAEAKADLVVFPELFLGMFRLPSPPTERIAEAARRHRLYVAIGCFEVRTPQGDFSNSILLFGRDGTIVGRYFKIAPAVGGPPYLWPPREDDPEWMMTPGKELPTFDLDFGRIGILTCYDGYFPEIPRILALKGAEILLWPNARNGDVEDYLVRSMIHYNYIHIVTTNKAMGGGTMIAAWPGKIIAQANSGAEAMIVSELPLNPLRQARANAREFFQRCPELSRDLLKSWPIWKQYGLKDPPGLKVPPPSRTAREAILRRSGVSAEKKR